MTQRQANFAAAVVACGNASEAYRLTYTKARAWKPETVHSAASRLLSKPAVAAKVADLRREAESSAVVTRTEVLVVLSRIIRACVGDLLRDDGSVDIEAARQARQEIKTIEVAETPQGHRRVRIRLRDPLAAANLLCKLQGYYKDDGSAASSEAESRRLADLREALAGMPTGERHAWIDRKVHELAGTPQRRAT